MDIFIRRCISFSRSKESRIDMKVLIVIPARYRSSRFPGKPLADIHGKTMIQHVYEKARMARKASRVIVATDDLRIFSVVRNFGGEVIMTSPDHLNGTDRVIEVAEKIKGDIFINVQGDEPLIRPEDIDTLIEKMLVNKNCKVTTLCHAVSEEEAQNPNVVKVIRSGAGKALYFSRRLIPYVRENDTQTKYLKHIGIYGYTAEILAEYKKLPYSHLEHLEKLEQLRLIEAGITIDIMETDRVAQGVDTPEDLEIVKQLITNQLDESTEQQQACASLQH
jgi:3-deoxy-manno-octulosonate cytidylyltransferase (CMP-KDO synthetase)